MPVAWPSFHVIVTPQPPTRSALSAASGRGDAGFGHTGSPRSRRPRHSAHGQLTRSSSRPNVKVVPSSQRRVSACARSSATSAGAGVSGGSIVIGPSLANRRVTRDNVVVPSAPKLSDDDVTARLGALDGWAREGDAIVKQYDLGTFPGAVSFVVRVGFLAE